MKYIISILAILLIVTGCSPCPSAQAHKDALLKEAQVYVEDVALPTIYSSRTGTVMEFDKPQVTFEEFRTTTGQPYFSATIYYYNPCLSFLDRFWIHFAHDYMFNMNTEDGYITLCREYGKAPWGTLYNNTISLSELAASDNLSWR